MNDRLRRTAPVSVFIRDEKFTIGWALPAHGGADWRLPEQAHMPTQKRETAKNYIGLLREEVEEPRAAETQYATERRVKAYVLGLMAAMFSRRTEAR
jgi:hypothetical protein